MVDPVTYRARVLLSFSVGHLVLNPSIVLRTREALGADAIVIADNDENALSAAFLAVLAWLRGVPVVLWSEHVPDRRAPTRTSSDRRRAWLRARYRRFLFRLCTRFISMSGEASTAFLRSFGVHEESITSGTQVMPRLMLDEPESARPMDAPYILFLGYLRPEKGIETLVDAFLASSAPKRGVDLVIAGSGALEDQLRARTFGEASIHLVGHVDGRIKATWLAHADALIVPSLYEPWGMVVNEAVHFGTPVLCSDAVAAAAILDPSDGSSVFAASDTGQLSALLDRFVSHFVDRSDCTPASVGARARATDVSVGVAPFLDALRRVGVPPV